MFSDDKDDKDDKYVQTEEADFIDNTFPALCDDLACQSKPEIPVDETLLRTIVRSAKIPIHVFRVDVPSDEFPDHFKMVPRFSYFESLASAILKNNDCDYVFTYNGVRCDDRFPVGISYDLFDPDEIPWRLVLERKPGKRKDFERLHMNSLKYAEYIETGNVTRINNFSREQYATIHRDILQETFQCADTLEAIRNRDAIVAVRIHFSDGSSFVRKMSGDSSIYGVVQGILVSKVRVKDVLYLKQVDNWLHVCLPNAIADVSKYIQDRKITVCFRSVASTPMIVKNIVKIPLSSTIEICRNYVSEKISKKSSVELCFYVEGLFRVYDEEPLFNMCLDEANKLTLYYSLGEAWT